MNDSLQDNSAAAAATGGQKIVVKLGGSILQSEENLAGIVLQISHLWDQGHEITVVHGAGPQINTYLQTQGIVPKFCSGLRITDNQTLMAVYAALGQANLAIVSALAAASMPAVALHAEPHLFNCSKKKGITGKGETIDLGWVGEIDSTDVDCLSKHKGSIGVISPIGGDQHRNKYNINADDAAFAVAVALKADRLIFVSDVAGVLQDKDDQSSIIPTLNGQQIEDLIGSGKVSGGMIPKLTNSLASAKAGVKYVSIISGAEKSALVNLVEGNGPAGTTIVADEGAENRPRSPASVGAA